MTTAEPEDLGVPSLRLMERVMVQHAHPLKLGCDSTGVLVCFHLTWRRRLPTALLVLVGSSVLGSVLARRADTGQLLASRLGRWMLGQARPVNLVVRTAGFVVSLIGTWRHSGQLIAGGAGMVVVARPLSTRCSARERVERRVSWG
jgi:hypothetical protein